MTDHEQEVWKAAREYREKIVEWVAAFALEREKATARQIAHNLNTLASALELTGSQLDAGTAHHLHREAQRIRSEYVIEEKKA